MIGAVEDDEFDIQSGLKTGWAVTFCILYIIVMIISILCYFLTIRAVALEVRAHNTTYLLVLLLFFAAIIEFGVIVGELMARFGYFSFTDTNCKLLTFAIHGNRILQISTTITMLYYNMIAVYLKTTKFQLLTRRYFPGLVLVLLLLEVLMVLGPVLGIRAGVTQQSCVFVSGDQMMEVRARDGWLYTVLFPYFLPLVAAVGPYIYLAIRLKEGHIIEPQRSQVMVTMAVVGGYFVFHLLYFILMTARQVEFLVDMSHMGRMLGVSVMFITRPLFVLIGHVWHIAVPLAVLVLDKELRHQWPGSVLTRAPPPGEEDSIVMGEVSLASVTSNNNLESGGGGKTEVSSTFSVMMLENREFHNNYTVNAQ